MNDWRKYDIVTSAKLNAIEQAIVDIEGGAEAGNIIDSGSDISTLYTPSVELTPRETLVILQSKNIPIIKHAIGDNYIGFYFANGFYFAYDGSGSFYELYIPYSPRGDTCSYTSYGLDENWGAY